MRTRIVEGKPRAGRGRKRKGRAGDEAVVHHEGSGLALGREPSEVEGGTYGDQLSGTGKMVSHGSWGRKVENDASQVLTVQRMLADPHSHSSGQPSKYFLSLSVPVPGETKESEMHRSVSSAFLELPVHGDGKVRRRHQAGGTRAGFGVLSSLPRTM